MKNVLLIVLLMAGLTACKNDGVPKKTAEESNKSTEIDNTKTDAANDTLQQAMTYVCPMHPEITSANAGDKCSKCGMDLVVKK